MKKNTFILAATIVLSFISGCHESNAEKNFGGEEQHPQEETLPKPGDHVTITVTLAEVEQVNVKTSVSMEESGSIVPVWQEGEMIKVNNELFTLKSFKGATATFEGIIPASEPYLIEIGETTNGSVTQESSGSISHLAYHAVISGVDDFREVVLSHGWAAEHGGKFFQSGALRLNLNFPDNSLTLSSVKFETGGIAPIEMNVGNGALDGNCFIAFLPFEEENLRLSAESQVAISVIDTDGNIYKLQFYPGTQTIQGGHVISLDTEPDLWRKITRAGGSLDGWNETDIAG